MLMKLTVSQLSCQLWHVLKGSQDYNFCCIHIMTEKNCVSEVQKLHF